MSRNTAPVTILTSQTTQAAGNLIPGWAGPKSYSAWGTTSSGTGSATIQIQGSNNAGTTWDLIGTITLTLGTAVTGDGFTSQDCYASTRANVSAISGTGASVSAAMGVIMP
jgi:hypothetical protein